MTDEAARGRVKPRTAVVHYNGAWYVRNLALCRRALTNRQVEGEFLGGIADLAQAIGLSRSNTTRFFAGHNTSTESTTKILGALQLRFDEVHTPVADEAGRDDDRR